MGTPHAFCSTPMEVANFTKSSFAWKIEHNLERKFGNLDHAVHWPVPAVAPDWGQKLASFQIQCRRAETQSQQVVTMSAHSQRQALLWSVPGCSFHMLHGPSAALYEPHLYTWAASAPARQADTDSWLPYYIGLIQQRPSFFQKGTDSYTRED